MNTPWKRFFDESPEGGLEIIINDPEYPNVYFYDEDNDSIYLKSIFTDEGVFHVAQGPDLRHCEWQYVNTRGLDKEGWIFPEEITGTEDADYWLVWGSEDAIDVSLTTDFLPRDRDWETLLHQ